MGKHYHQDCYWSFGIYEMMSSLKSLKLSIERDYFQFRLPEYSTTEIASTIWQIKVLVRLFFSMFA